MEQEYQDNPIESVKDSGAFEELLRKFSETTESDVWLFNGGIENDAVDSFIRGIEECENRRKNLFLILTTRGGNPHAGYRLARFVKTKYDKFTLGIFGRCKSAGTLIAVGADELVMSEFAELGPLDVQILREDEFRTGSVLDLQQALYLLSSSVYNTFETCLFKTVERAGGLLSAKTAADVASQMAVGFIAPIAAQIDPVKLGELNRSTSIASAYGYRLIKDEERKASVIDLASAYPSHSFVIDYDEAKELFPDSVRRPTKVEAIISKVLYDLVRDESEELNIINLSKAQDPSESSSGQKEVEDDENQSTANGNPDNGDSTNSQSDGNLKEERLYRSE